MVYQQVPKAMGKMAHKDRFEEVFMKKSDEEKRVNPSDSKFYQLLNILRIHMEYADSYDPEDVSASQIKKTYPEAVKVYPDLKWSTYMKWLRSYKFVESGTDIQLLKRYRTEKKDRKGVWKIVVPASHCFEWLYSRHFHPITQRCSQLKELIELIDREKVLIADDVCKIFFRTCFLCGSSWSDYCKQHPEATNGELVNHEAPRTQWHAVVSTPEAWKAAVHHGASAEHMQAVLDQATASTETVTESPAPTPALASVIGTKRHASSLTSNDDQTISVGSSYDWEFKVKAILMLDDLVAAGVSPSAAAKQLGNKLGCNPRTISVWSSNRILIFDAYEQEANESKTCNPLTSALILNNSSVECRGITLPCMGS